MSLKGAFTLALATVLWLGGCATQPPSGPPLSSTPAAGDAPAVGAVIPPQVGEVPSPAPDAVDTTLDREIERGRASWYGPRFHGRRTASGETFNMHDLTAAHKTLPFGTRVRVRNLANGQEVAVRINDRGPHVRGRVIDLSRAAAQQIGLLQMGLATIVVLRD